MNSMHGCKIVKLEGSRVEEVLEGIQEYLDRTDVQHVSFHTATFSMIPYAIVIFKEIAGERAVTVDKDLDVMDPVSTDEAAASKVVTTTEYKETL